MSNRALASTDDYMASTNRMAAVLHANQTPWHLSTSLIVALEQHLLCGAASTRAHGLSNWWCRQASRFDRTNQLLQK
jgi:hypothetical protein